MNRILLTALTAALLGSAAVASAQSVTIGFADPVSSIDPQLNNHAGDRSLALHLFDSIVDRHDSGNLPSLALSWKTLDEKTWEFKLRPNVVWSDGVPFTADDLVYSFERARKVPGSVASYASSLRTVESATAKDPLTLIIKTNIPNPELLTNIGAVHIVSRHVGEKASTEDYNAGRAAIGTGPYVLTSWTPGDRAVFARNDKFWGPKPTWEKVTYRYINNAAARTAALLAGDVDVIDKVSASDVARLRKTPNISVYPYPGLRVLLVQPSFRKGPNEFITDNVGKQLPENPLLDVRVRRALNIAINRKTLIDRVMQGTATEANQWMPANTFGYNPDVKDIAYDPTAAKKLLADAGFPEGFKLTVHVPGDRYPLGAETLQAVAQFWSRIGVKTNLEVVPWSVYSARANKNEFAISIVAWGNGTGEAAYGLQNVFATADAKKGLGNSNWGHYSSVDVDKALEAATVEFNTERRAAILRHSVKLVTDDVAAIPLFHYQNIWAAKKGLKVEPYISDRTTAMQVTKQ